MPLFSLKQWSLRIRHTVHLIIFFRFVDPLPETRFNKPLEELEFERAVESNRLLPGNYIQSLYIRIPIKGPNLMNLSWVTELPLPVQI